MEVAMRDLVIEYAPPVIKEQESVVVEDVDGAARERPNEDEIDQNNEQHRETEPARVAAEPADFAIEPARVAR